MANDGSVKIGVDVDKQGFESKLSGLGGFAQKGLGVVNSVIKGTAAAIGGVAAGVGAFGKYAFDVGSQFQAGMSNVSAISGAVGQDLEDLKQKALDVAGSSKFTATEVADGFSYMAMAGWEAEDMMAGIEGITNLAAAAGEDLATTSDIVTDALTAFGMSAGDAGQLADVLAAASSSANTNVSMLGESFKYVAPVAGSLGYSAEDTAIALGLMANAGIKASQGGTALRNIMTRMAKPTKESAKAMDALGLSLTDDEGNMKSFMEVMQDMRDGFGELKIPEEEFQKQLAELDAQLESGEIKEKDYNKSLGDLMERAYGAEGAMKAEYAAMLAGKEGMSGLLAIVNSSDEDFQKLTDNIYNSEGAAKQMADTMKDNLAGQITILKSGIESLAISIEAGLEGTMKDIVVEAQGMVSELQNAFNEGGLEGLVSKGGEVLADIAMGAAEAIPQIIDVAVNLINAFLMSIDEHLPEFVQAGAGVVSSLANGIISVLETIGPVALDIIMALTSSLAENGGEMVSSGMGLIANVISGISEALPDLLTNIVGVVSSIAQGFVDGLPDILSAGKDLIFALIDGVVAALPDLIGAILDLALQIAETIFTTDWVQLGKDLITKILDGIKELVPKLIETFGDFGKKAVEKLKKVDWVQLGKDTIKAILEGVKFLFYDIPNAIADIGNEAMNAMLSVDWLGVGANMIEGIKQGVINFAGHLVDAAIGAVRNAVDAVKGWLHIKSPSRRMRDEVGVQMIAGVNKGIEKETPEFTDTAVSAVQTATTAMQKKADFVLGMKNVSTSKSGANTKAAEEYYKNMATGGTTSDIAGGDGEIIIYNTFELDGREIERQIVRKTKQQIEREQRANAAAKGRMPVDYEYRANILYG